MERRDSQESVLSKQPQDSGGSSKKSLFSSPSKVSSREGGEGKARERAGSVEGSKKPSTKAERRALQVKGVL